MVEYGNGVSDVAGKVDVGASMGQFVSNSVHTISTMPPAYLVVGIVVIFLGLIMLRRAF
jgi:hypothetical protein